MLLGFRTELKINNQTRTLLAKHAGVARHAWNWGLNLTLAILDNNKKETEDKIKFPSVIDLHKWLVALVKPDNAWYYEVSKCAPQYALKALSEAWKRCFSKVSQPPRFKKKGKNDSFTLDGTIRIRNSNSIQVPVIGNLKTYERLPCGYIPKSVTISRSADRWFISFKIEVEKQKNNYADIIGIDLGLLNFATCSNGEVYDSPRPLKQLEKKLAKLQWSNRNKQKNSNSWNSAQVKIAKLHLHIANMRKDFLHKMTSNVAKNHSTIVIEDLNVKGMLANRKLSKAVSDSGFYELRRQLTYKTELYGSKLVVADRWFASSKICSNCGQKKDSLPLSERTYSCDNCQLVLDRDLNAALNLALIGGATPKFTPIDKHEPTHLVEVGSRQQF